MYIVLYINEYVNLNKFEKISFFILFIFLLDKRGSEVNNDYVRKSMYNWLNKNRIGMD